MTDAGEATSNSDRKRLAIVGAGSSGLITLKYCRDALPDWDIVAFERSDNCVGVWRRPYDGFVSTSTKFTTQFAGWPQFSAETSAQARQERADFFREGEYGDYLEGFAEAFELRQHIRFHREVTAIVKTDDGRWRLAIKALDEAGASEGEFMADALVLCSGVTAQLKPVKMAVPALAPAELNEDGSLERIRNQTIVVMGGGESAVDHASRLAAPNLGNRVYLSLRSGIRVSPRYHPIRGVPSDYLRNRLMLSIHHDLRNRIGQRFVELRMRYEPIMRKLFRSRDAHEPNAQGCAEGLSEQAALAREREAWAWRLTQASRNNLFDMFHNKSDDFLDLVARGRITIIGPASDGSGRRYRSFDGDQTLELAVDRLAPSIGYRSTIECLSDGVIKPTDFYLGCQSVEHDNLFLVGFARPIIGNIPSISEMQARYIASALSGAITREPAIVSLHEADRCEMGARFHTLDLATLYPVEMFPYCDRLACLLDAMPTRRRLGSWDAWLHMKLGPATTLHYFDDEVAREALDRLPVYLPWSLIAVLLAIKPVDWCYRAWQRMTH